MNPTLLAGIGAAVLFVAVAIGVIVSRRWQRNSPWGLFRQLCAAHRLNLRERRLLTHLAWQHRLQHPAMLFLDARLLDATDLGPAWRGQVVRLAGLKERLFQRG